jgi:hypothetical protein
MTLIHSSRLFVLGGASGIVGTLCYIITAVVPLGQTLTYTLAMAWPVLSVIFAFSLCEYIKIDRHSSANQLAFVFAALGFAMVAAMISIQLAVRTGIEEHAANSPENQEFLKLIRRSIRLVDMGLDVAWDLLIGTSLIFLGFALIQHKGFGTWWAVPAGLLGGLLIVLNVSTFPWPPNTQGLFDIGPAIGLFIIAVSVRLLLLGIRMKYVSTDNSNPTD